MKYKVAAIQIETGADKEENVRKALGQLDLAAEAGVELACLHEYFNAECPEKANTPEQVRNMAETIPGPTIDAIAGKAREHKIHIAAGTILESDQDRLYNTSALIDARGEIIGKYSKSHPEDAGAKKEVGRGITPGDEFPVFETDIGRIGIMVDVDGSVPGVVEVLTAKEANVICWPMNWSTRWINSVEYLPSAWGMVSRAFVICANRVGRRSAGSEFQALSYHGSSRVADPEGNVIAKASNFFEGMAVATIDTSFTELWRKEIIPHDYPMRRRVETYQFVAQSLTGKS